MGQRDIFEYRRKKEEKKRKEGGMKWERTDSLEKNTDEISCYGELIKKKAMSFVKEKYTKRFIDNLLQMSQK